MNSACKNTWTSVDVTSYITGNGTFSFALTTSDVTALSLASRESTNPPQLIVETSGVGLGGGGSVRVVGHAGGSVNAPLLTTVVTTTYYVGNYYEVTGSTVTKYYYFGAQRVAMKQGSTVTYLYGDHLGSTSVAADSSGTVTAQQTYYPYGGVRTGSLPTDFTFTGQRVDASAGLMYYGARYYDTAVARFIQPDTKVTDPYNPQDLNRYSYTLNNPVRYTDPTGYCDPDECTWTHDPDGGWIITNTGNEVMSDDPGSGGGTSTTFGLLTPSGLMPVTDRDPYWQTYVVHDTPSAHRRRSLTCGQYCRAEFGVNLGWVSLGAATVAPETAPVTVPLGKLLTLLGGTLGVNYGTDRYGDNFGGFWIGAGKGPLPVSFDLITGSTTFRITEGHVTDWNPGQEELIDYPTGWSLTAKVGALESAGISGNLGGFSFEMGSWTTPQVGGSGSVNWRLPTYLPHFWWEHP